MVRGLVKRYKEVEAVRGIDLDVVQGETFGFLGPNGAGKSTTIKVLCTLVEATSGTAEVAGFDVVKDRAAVRRHIGLVFQEPTLDGYLTGEQNLRFHGELYGVDRSTAAARREEVLRMVGLWERRGDPAQTYSGGMRRRLEIARGLLHSPAVLFLDEPTIGLDPQTRASIWEYLRELHRNEEITVFVTTHYMDEAENCDRIAIMNEGRIVALDTPDRLKAAVGEDRVRITTEDDAAAITALRERFDVRAEVHEGAVSIAVPDGAGLRSPAVRRAQGADPVGHGQPAQPRRRVPGAHRPDDPGRGDHNRRDASDGDDGARPMSARPVSAGATGAGGTGAGGTSAAGPGTRIAAVRVPAAGLAHQARAAFVVWEREMIRFSKDRARILSTLVQPALFLFVLGSGLASLVSAGTSGVDFRTFLYPGVLAISVLFTAAFSGISMVWDREFGFLREMLVAPVSTTAILTGKCVGGATVATLQSLVLLALAPLVGVPYSLPMMLSLVGLLFLLAFMITALGLLLAARVKQVQSAMPMVQLIITPLMFLSGALFPLTGLPTWLAVVTLLNPMTYAVEPMRAVVFDHLDVDPAARAALDPGIYWGSFQVPVSLQILIVVVFSLGLLAAAVLRFARTE